MPRAVVLYDRDCGFCRWALAKILAWDRRRALRPVPIESKEGEQILEGMPRENRLASWHLRGDDGEVRSAGAAFPELFRLLPGGRPLSAAAARAPRLTDRVYRWVAANRSRFGPRIPDRAKRRADERIAERSSAS